MIAPPFEWVGHGLLVSLAAGLALTLVVGLLFIVLPDAGLRIHRQSSRWVETRDLAETLNRARYLEALFYRHHRVTGAALIAGAAYVLWSWVHSYDRTQVLSAMGPSLRAQALDWIVPGLESAAVIIHLLVLLLGVAILVRPSSIRGLEARANRWYGGDGRFAAMMDREYHAPEQWLALHPRLLGLAALCGSTYALAALYAPLRSVLGA